MEIAIGAAFISTILKPMAAKAMDIIKDKVKARVFRKVDGIVNIERDISKLQETLCMIEGIVQEAEEKRIDNGYIQKWLHDLVDIGYEARDVLDDFITYSSITASKPVNFISSLCSLNRLGNDIRSVMKRFDKTTKESKTFTTLKSVVPSRPEGEGSETVRVDRRPEVGPLVNKQRDALFLGREDVKKGIMEKILHPSDDNTVHVVAIWGMGGIGKTTLAQSIYNDERVKEDEYPTKNRRWLCVGENKFSVKEIITKIINDSSTTNDVESLHKKLVEKFRDKRFLIVLDDVWDVDGSEWDLLLTPLTHVGKGGLIIITTRKSEVCPAITIQAAYNLKPLSEEDSWSIFESCAYVNGKADTTSELKRIGEEIVKKLNGLPLALKVVGRSLLNKDSSTWTNFLESKLTKDDEVISALRWSYNHLPQHLKTCFTYCALFPKDLVLDKKLLVQMWMAHDLIQKEKQKRPEDVGAQYFEELVNASLLQCVDGKYVIHDLIYDLAVLVSNGVITHVVSNGEFATANGSLSIDQMVRHITIKLGDYSKIPRLCKIEKLLTLYITKIYTPEKFNYSVLDDVFKQLKSIRMLVLDSEEITDIPDCISELRHLRYLDVSKTGVRSLPDSLCRLYNLQMIAARPYVTLPRDVVKMVNLRYIRANLSTSKGVGKLTSLQELSSIYVCRGDNIRELGDMQELRGKLTINGLENAEKLEDVAGALMEKQTLMAELKLVFIRYSVEPTISEEVLDALGCPPNLTYLRIAGYNGLKPPSWMVDRKHKFEKLQTLELLNCPKLESLPPLGELTSLKHFSLESVGVKRLGDEFYGKFTDGKVFFPTLESLCFYRMKEWEEWDDIIIGNSSVSFFPRLTSLELTNCPKLESLPPLGELTSLKRLSLWKVGVKRLGEEIYGKFTDGKLFFPSLESLSFILMTEWEEWDDIIIENSSVSFFPRLTRLEIQDCANLVSVLPVIKNATNFMTSLSSLSIRDCDGLKRLQLDALVSLKELGINRCSTLVQITSAICLATTIERLQIYSCELLETMGFERLPSLKHLDVKRCNNLISIPRLVVIKILKLEGCESLRSLSIDIHGLDSLEHLDITGCPTLELAFEDGSCSSSLGNSVAVPLHYIRTDNTHVFRTLLHHELVSITQVLDIRKITGFVSLRSSSPSLFGETEANNFCKSRSLKGLRISECEDLSSLPVDFHNLSSLTRLEIFSCPQLQSLPPDFHKLSSLKKLTIKSCPLLQSLPPDFHKLSSLEGLQIFFCPQLQSLPADGFLPSLTYLIIQGCPLLYERCKDESGPDWHKINHIRRKKILP